MRIVRDSWSHDKPPHAIPRVQTLIRSQTRTQDQNVDQKGQSIFFTLRFPPQFFLFPPPPRQFYYFPSSYSTSSFFIYLFPPPPPHFYCFPTPPTPLPHLCCFHSPYCFPTRQAKKANLRPKYSKSSLKGQTQAKKAQLKEPILLVGKQ